MKMGTTFATAAVLSAIAVAGIGGWSVAAAETAPKTILSLEWPTGYGPPESIVMLSRFVSESSGKINLSAQETAGDVYNIKEMSQNKNRWDRTIFGTGANIFYLAENGVAPFFDKPIKVEWKHLFADAVWMLNNFITLDPSIKSPADFKGKRIALGQRTGSEWAAKPTIILREAYGITDKNATISYLDAASAVSALLDGRVDVAIAGIITNSELNPVLPHRNLQEASASGRRIYYVEIGADVVARLRNKTGAPYISIPVPPNSLPQQGDRTLSLVGNQGFHSAHPSFPEEHAYEVTKHVIQAAPKVAKFGGLGTVFRDPRILTAGLTEQNTHPGAIRAFKEAGLWPPKPAAYER